MASDKTLQELMQQLSIALVALKDIARMSGNGLLSGTLEGLIAQQSLDRIQELRNTKKTP